MIKTFKLLLPEVKEGFQVQMKLYDDKGSRRVLGQLLEWNRGFIQAKMFSPRNENGFSVLMDNKNIIVVFINLETRHPLEEVLIHELFHVATKLEDIKGDEKFGAEIYARMYKKFLPILQNNSQ